MPANSRSARPAAGLIAGLLGGLAGAYAMSRFQACLMSPSRSALDEASAGGGRPEDEPRAGASEPATVQVAERVSRRVLQRDLTETEKPVAGRLVHYGFGAKIGALYGAIAEFLPGVGRGLGLPFGAAVWVAADEVGVPTAGLSAPPLQIPLKVHGYAFASHLVYGLTADLCRRFLRLIF